MWHVEQQDRPVPILPEAEELKAALTPPVTSPEKRQPNYILRVQLLLCALLAAGALALRQGAPEAFLRWGQTFRDAMAGGVELGGQEELLKFTGEAVDALRGGVEEALASLEPPAEQADSGLTGAGGGQAALWPFVPEGNSTKSYQPPFALALPVSGFSLTSDYGWRKHPITGKSDFHTGVDLAAAEGAAIRPAAGGVVLKSEYSTSYGNNVVILHESGVTTRYCHMQYVFVRVGEPVGSDTVLGTVGQTGDATGPHLHFELLYEGVRYDPADALGLS